MKRCVNKTCLAILLCLTTPLFSQSIPMNIDPQSYVQPKRAATKEQAVEEVSAYFLETMFLSGMVGMDQSLLTDEEKEDSFINTNSDIEKSMMIKALAKSLAEKDVLGLKRQLLRTATPLPPDSERSFR